MVGAVLLRVVFELAVQRVVAVLDAKFAIIILKLSVEPLLVPQLVAVVEPLLVPQLVAVVEPLLVPVLVSQFVTKLVAKLVAKQQPKLKS